ncbi:hypothetical protein L5515_011048 [Caenorhabditis briggsae]|uniref:Ubiquitin carboxyl-terminal hydrolase n=1 Tax=Caenorhabditis briggsae TaxID=6238 RepID=A0AAE9EVD2_CAEBR|nr:hypothetical protein L5515_011048 [Caenorhabditis briggsae]
MPTPEDVPMDDHENVEVAEKSNEQSNGQSSPTREDLQKLLQRVERASLKENESWFLISQKWWNAFVKSVRDGFIEDAGPIDNSQISECRQGVFYLKQRLAEQIDYTTIPEDCFKELVRYFGVDDERRDYIERQVIKKNNSLSVDVYPRIIYIALARNRAMKVELILKPEDTMVTLRDRVIQELNLNESDSIRFYVMNDENPELIDTTQSIDSYFDTVQKVLVDVEENGEFFFKNKNPTQPQSKSLFGNQSSSDLDSEIELDDDDEFTIRLPKPKSNNRRRQFSTSTVSSATSRVLMPFLALWLGFRELWWGFSQIWPNGLRQMVALVFGWSIFQPPNYAARLGGNGNGASNSYSYSSSSAHRTTPGACGLSNLGNTCFMASALQCLSNVPPLRDYFLNNKYTEDINDENPLGTRGNLALAVGELMKGMWSGEYSSINPRKFKGIIGQFAPRFNGYTQQDAHELMAYMLDGLHEDLNRVKQKPYIQDNDEDQKLPEAEYAAKSWHSYKLRNDSIIVDLMHGQLRSTLVCPVCDTVSIKFDPFGYISLPLPAKEQIVRQTVIVMFLERKWAKFSLGITDTTTVEDAERLMLEKLQPEKKHHFVFFHVPSQYHDDITVLRPSDKVRVPGREVYVAEVEHDLSVKGTRIFVAYNRIKLLRPASLPMIYSLPPGDVLTRGFLNDHVFATTKKFFINHKISVDVAANSNDEDSMNGSNSADEREPYKLFAGPPGTQTPLPIPPTDEPIAFPNENSHDVYHNFLQISFQWKDSKLFNNYKGLDLIEREMTVSTRRKVFLEETLDWYTKKEQLGEQDSWYCPKCKKHERATKQLDMWKLPEILVLHLKRFQYTKWSREKLTWEVVIPVRGLDLTNKIVNPNHEKAIYDLIAVSRHYGSMSGGHYTAAAFNDHAQKWYDFNDSSASATYPPTDPYESSDPYILVYRRRPLDSRGEPLEPETTAIASQARPKRGAAPSISSATTSSASSSRHQVDENMEMEED